METSNHFTCLSYDTVDFLIQSKYILFGIYLQADNNDKNILFEKELLPHIRIGGFLENYFSCKTIEECNVMLVLNQKNYPKELQRLLVDYTNTEFPASGNFAISVNTSVTSRIMDTSYLRLIPYGIRTRQNECGVSAIGFIKDLVNPKIIRKQILISPDGLLQKFLKTELYSSKNEG